LAYPGLASVAGSSFVEFSVVIEQQRELEYEAGPWPAENMGWLFSQGFTLGWYE
jgi:hypothetical protein